MRSTKADESFTYESVVPLRGFRILTSFVASWCVEEPMADTIGRRGVPSLCTFGRKQICGAEVKEGARKRRCLVDKWPFCSSSFKAKAILVYTLVVGSRFSLLYTESSRSASIFAVYSD